MLREIFETTSSVLRLAQDVKASQDAIKEIQNQLHDLVIVVEGLRYEMQRVSEREAREREMLMLQMENVLLRERQALALPSTGHRNGRGRMSVRLTRPWHKIRDAPDRQRSDAEVSCYRSRRGGE